MLKDSRRINVVLTRARSKLIVVGSRTTLAGTAAPSQVDELLLPKLLRVLSMKKWILTLPLKAHALHGFPAPPESLTQLLDDDPGGKFSTTAKKGHIGSNILKSRSMLRDIANDI